MYSGPHKLTTPQLELYAAYCIILTVTQLSRDILFFSNELQTPFVSLRQADFPANWVMQHHQHPYAQILFIRQGTMAHTCQNQHQLLQSGDWYYVPPYHQHHWHIQNDHCLVDDFCFQPEDNRAVAQQYALLSSYGSFLPRRQGGALSQLWQQCLTIAQDASDPGGLKLTGLLYQWLAEFVQQLRISYQDYAENGEQMVQAAEAFMNESFAQPLNLDRIASHIHCTGKHLCKLFARQRSHSPMEWLSRVRIREAKRLLGMNEITISEIAQRCGYADPSYFTRLFKQHTGLSPRAWRQQLSGE